MRSLLLCLLTTLLPAAPPAAPVQEVAIVEHLGRTIALDQPLRAEDGSPVTLAALSQRPTLLTLNYFGCPGLCTAQLQGVVDVLNATRAVPGTDFQVVTVSFDPLDTPAIAAQKRSNYLNEVTRPMPAGAWRFLTGTEQATRALTEAVGFKFRKEGDAYVHPAAIIVLSPKGVVTRYLYGITYLPADLEMAVQEAGRGEARPTISRMLSICFSSDPGGRQYVSTFTRVAATAILVLACVFIVMVLLKGRHGKAGV
jgi:protein SCO1/2